jgi:hypothetical protein
VRADILSLAAGRRRLGGAVYGLLTMLAAGLVALSRVADSDVWWHIANGEWLLAHGWLPAGDVFSHTATGARDVPYAWLFDLLAALWARAVGIELLPLMQAGIVALLFGVLFRTGGLLGLPAPARAIALVAVAPLLRFHLVPRPHLLGYLCLGLLLLAVAAHSRSGRLRSLLAAVLTIWVWRQLHASYPLGLAVLGLYLAFPWILRSASGASPGAQSSRGSRALVLCGASAVLVLPPLGWEGTRWIFETLRLVALHQVPILEWTPPAAFGSRFDGFWLYCAVGLTGLLASPRARTPFVVGSFAMTCLMALGAIRHVCPFVLLTIVPVTAAWCEVLERLSRRWTLPRPALMRAATAAALGVACAMSLRAGILGAYPPFGLGVVAEAVPAGAARFIEANGLRGNVYNTYRLGGYLVWRLAPAGIKVFWDGRLLIYAGLFERVRAAGRAADGGHALDELLRELDVGLAVLDYRDASPIARRVLGHPDWALVYWDDSAMVLVRRAGPHGRQTARESRMVRPWDRSLAFLEAPRAQLVRMRAELGRKLDEDPASSRAAALLGIVLLKLGEPAQAVDLLQSHLRRRRESSWVRLVLAQALMSCGRPAEALEALQGLDERDEGVLHVREEALRALRSGTGSS